MLWLSSKGAKFLARLNGQSLVAALVLFLHAVNYSPLTLASFETFGRNRIFHIQIENAYKFTQPFLCVMVETGKVIMEIIIFLYDIRYDVKNVTWKHISYVDEPPPHIKKNIYFNGHTIIYTNFYLNRISTDM